MFERATDFIQSIGVNAVPSAATAAELAYLGVDQVRTSDAYGAALATDQALGKSGVRFDLVSAASPASALSVQAETAAFDQLSPYVAAVEGPEDVNVNPVSYEGMTGAAATDAFQADLFKAVHADTALAGAKVLPFSLSIQGSMKYGSVSGSADEANFQSFATGGAPPAFVASYNTAQNTSVQGEPAVMGETGYYTLQDGASGVTQAVQADWDVDTLLDDARSGIVQTYLSTLQDGTGTAASAHYGLFGADGSQKMAATAIHDLTAILADPNAATAVFPSYQLSYGLTGLPTGTGYSDAFRKSDGTTDIALWNEANFYSSASGTASAVTPSSVTIALQGYGTYTGNLGVKVYDVITGAVLASYAAASSVTVSLGTDPVIVEVAPPAAAAPSVPTITGLAAGTDTGVSATDGVTTDATPTVAGTADAGSLVTLYNGSTAVGTATAAGSGAWSVQVALHQGSNALTATASTGGGTPSAYSAPAYVTVDNQAPQVTSITASASSSPAHVGQLLTFALSATEPLSVAPGAAAPSLALSDGATAAYSAALSSASSMVFTATVAGGQGSADLKVAGLDAPAGSVTDLAGNALQPLAQLAGADTGIVVDTTPGAVTVGSGPSSLVLQVAEDASQGDAQFTVSVDGKQVGGVFTAGVLKSSGADQAFSLLGNWGGGSHTVGVDLLNGAAAPSSAAGRNLYVASATYDGVAVAGSSLSLQAAGTQSFTASEAAPAFSVQSPDRRYVAGQAFSFAISASTFTGPGGAALTYRAQTENGQPLPSWLAFNPASDTFSGTAPASGGVLPVVVVAATADGAAAAEEFHIYTSVPPVLQQQAPDQRLATGHAFSFALPTASYADPAGGSIGYTAVQTDGTPLPAWLSFNAATDTFAGTTPASATSLGVMVQARSSASGDVSAEAFHIYTNSSVPLLQHQAPDERFTGGQTFSFALPAGCYTDPSGGTLSFKAVQSDGHETALPSWLTFNASTDTFSGKTPAATGTLGIEVIATSSTGGSSAEGFHVYTTAAPVLQSQAPDERLTGGAAFSFALPPNSYSSPDGGPLSFSARSADLSALPSWLAFNASTQTFTGTAPVATGSSSAAAAVRVDVMADNGTSAAEAFHVYLK